MTDIASPETLDGATCTRTDLANWLQVTAKTIDSWRRTGQFPKPITPEGIAPRWLVGDIRKHFNIGSAREVAKEQQPADTAKEEV